MKIGIDLGTANVLVYVKGKGVVIQEPSVVAVSEDNRIVAVGEEAREMIGRTPGSIAAIRPMKDGVIADYVITEAMLRYFIGRATRGSFSLTKPEVMISVPAGVCIASEKHSTSECEAWMNSISKQPSLNLSPGFFVKICV